MRLQPLSLSSLCFYQIFHEHHAFRHHFQVRLFLSQELFRPPCSEPRNEPRMLSNSPAKPHEAKGEKTSMPQGSPYGRPYHLEKKNKFYPIVSVKLTRISNTQHLVHHILGVLDWQIERRKLTLNKLQSHTIEMV